MFDLEGYVEFALQHARDDVSRHLHPMMLATVIDSQGEMVLMGAQNLQTERDRDGWVAQINHKIAETRAQAVVLAAGVNRGEYSAEGRKKFKELHSAGVQISIDDAVALGLCKKVQSIMVTLYTPLQTAIRVQNYEYVRGKAVFGPVEKLDDNMGGEFFGRFANFFEKAKTTHHS